MCHNQTEDEIHFITECKLYGTHDHYWNIVYEKCPNLKNLSNRDKFIYLMTQEDKDLTTLVMKLVSEWSELRTFLCDFFFQPKA